MQNVDSKEEVFEIRKWLAELSESERARLIIFFQEEMAKQRFENARILELAKIPAAKRSARKKENKA